MKKLLSLALLGAFAASLAGCADNATVVSQNISKAADNFEVKRRVVFYNGITGDYMRTIEGLCSLGSGSETKSMTVMCKTGPNDYKKHFLGLSHNVTFISEQIDGVNASPYHYRVTFKPSVILPDIRLQ